MAIFTPKSTCVFITGGSCIAGGGALYYYQMPKTWGEQFTKEGRILLSQKNEFKAIYYDQKDTDVWKGESSFEGKNTSNDAQNALSDFCTTELGKELPGFYNKEYSKNRDKLLILCTSEGIVTVKGRITQSGKDNWMTTDTEEDENYKITFAVYKHLQEFLTGLNKQDPSSDPLTKESKTDEHYTKLKNACKNLLAKPYKAVEETDKAEIQNASGWCTPLSYKTIKDKLKHGDSGWEERSQSDKKGSELVETGKNTPDVKAVANSSGAEAELNVTTLKALCNEEKLKKKLNEKDIYQKTYIVIKSVCKKENKSPQP